MNQYDNNGGPISFANCEIWSAKLNYATKPTTIESQSDAGALNAVEDYKNDITISDDVQRDVGTTVRTANDANVAQTSPHKEMSIKSSILTMPNDGVPASVKSFLGKPFKFVQGDLTTTDLPTTFPNYQTSDPLRANPLYVEKLSGVMSIRYTTVITLQVNANRFQQGRYILAFLPTGGACVNETNNAQNASWIFMHRANKTQITQLHHCEIDINTTTEVQLRIPYQSAFTALSWYPTPGRQYFGDPGAFFIYPYSPLKSAVGNTTAGYTLWVHYEDIEVFGNTVPMAPLLPPASVESQMAWNPRKARGGKKLDLLAAESGVSQPLSKGLKMVSEGLAMTSNIPLLSSITQPLSWAADAASTMTGYMGWSKPQITTPIVRMNRFPHAHIANEDQPDDSQNIALFSNNHVEVLPGFAGNDIDELSIDYLKSIPSYFHQLNWTSSNTRGLKIWTKTISPYEMQGPIQENCNVFTPVAFLSTMFSRYTGGIRIHLKFVKTEFHSGRLMFAFNPFESGCATSNMTYADTEYLHKTILDIREQTDFIIEVPYVSIVPWRQSQGAATSLNTAMSYGEVALFVLDPLVAPETVVNNVDILVEASGADDLRFSVPIGSSHIPNVPTQLQMGDFKSIDNPSAVDVVDVSVVGGASQGVANFDGETACVGEVVQSFRSLLKRGGVMGYTTAAQATTQNINLLPYAWIAQDASSGGYADVTYDIYTILSSIFCLQRGGVRIRYMATSAAGLMTTSLRNTVDSEAQRDDIFHITNLSTQDFIDDCANRPLVNQLTQMGGIAVNVPYYHYTHSSPSSAQMIAVDAHYTFKTNKGANAVSLQTQFQPAVNFATVYTYRSGSDDCNFGGFVSIPLFRYLDTRPA